MDKELTVLKWVLIVRLKIPQMPQKVLAQNGKSTDYGHAKAKSQILCGPNSNPTAKSIFVFFVEIMVD